MVEPILSLASAVITLIATIFGIIQDKKSLEKKQEIKNIQLQKISDISTSGDNPSINIMAMQIQDSILIRKYQEEQIENQLFLENLGRLSAYNKCFLVLCPVVILALFFAEKISSLTIALQTCTIIVSSFAISLYFRYMFYRYVLKIKIRGREMDLASRMIRAVEFTVFPLLLLIISILNLFFSLIKYPSKIDENSLYIILVVAYFISAYVEFLLFNFVVAGNIWSIKIFLKKFFIVLGLMFITILVGLVVYASSI
ncbi:hypothetical protein ACR035_001847 [Enterococcus faecalis]|uniref:hypothetical protein n=1 Tax=Enterococcus faecalis TaxID=1351 RepID=UPI0019F3C0A1|nr:hypothetical protein [Enterococcus faecalis]EGO8184713.1 hypothetical protein [Enterococcus faecalis]EGS8068226.1 hypothetical protein [Enterococcus faecalis]EHH1618109.1 hypothetical protein [Enterococcus faecalis]EHH1631313.1 hypothetical protein [Enterococcus faecalis]